MTRRLVGFMIDCERAEIGAASKFWAAALVKLSATRVAKPHGRWWVMQAPTGHRFCVVRQQPAKPGIASNRWGRR